MPTNSIVATCDNLKALQRKKAALSHTQVELLARMLVHERRRA